MANYKLLRMDNILIVVKNLEAVQGFFLRLGFELEGKTVVEGPTVDALIGLEGVNATLVFLKTPDGQFRIELDHFHTPETLIDEVPDASVNALGYRRIMLEVEGLDGLVDEMLAHGAQLVGEVVQYGNSYRLAYIQGPEGILVGLSERIIQ